MTDFIELTRSDGLRRIINAASVLTIDEGNTGKATIWLHAEKNGQPGCFEPRETYQQVRACLNPVEKNR